MTRHTVVEYGGGPGYPIASVKFIQLLIAGVIAVSSVGVAAADPVAKSEPKGAQWTLTLSGGALVPAEGGRTVVTMQGGLTSKDDLENSPAFSVAQTTYRLAAERWLGRVAGTLEAREPR